MNRRQFIKTAGTLGGTLLTARSWFAIGSDLPVIDTHIHLFDTGRKGGVPWPEKEDSIYKPALPSRYQSMVKGFGIVGAIAIEASPLPSDNKWLLETAKTSPLIVGVIGDLDPAASDYADCLDVRFQQVVHLIKNCEAEFAKTFATQETRWTTTRMPERRYGVER